jgi:hypothetical protein
MLIPWTFLRHSVFAISLACLTVGSAAIDSSRPLIVVRDGDVWQYSGRNAKLDRPQRLTSWAHNWGPSLSPNARFVVYGSDARRAVETCKQRDDCGDVSLPSNIWLRDLTTNRSSRIADQPKGDPIKRGIQRSRPTWSPDGTRIAWTELQGSRYRLAVYSLASGSTTFRRLYVSLPGSGEDESTDVFVPDPIIWGEVGIVLPVSNRPGGSQYASALLLEPNGVFRRLIFPHEIGGWLVFARENDRTVLAGHDADFLLDPITGTSSELNGQLESFVPGATNGLSVLASTDGCELLRAGSLVKPLPNSNSKLFGCDTAIAPDGSSVAYSENSALTIDDGRDVQKVVSAKDYVAVWDWGKLEYRIKR